MGVAGGEKAQEKKTESDARGVKRARGEDKVGQTGKEVRNGGRLPGILKVTLLAVG